MLLDKKIIKDKYSNITPPWGAIGYIVFKRTYARQIEDENRTEEWWEMLFRCVNSIQEDVMEKHAGKTFTIDELYTLYDHLFYMRAMLSGRDKWQLGTPLVKNGFVDSLHNCWLSCCDSIRSILFLFEESALGGGVTSVIAEKYVAKLPPVFPRVKIVRDEENGQFSISDSRQGWVLFLKEVLESFLITGKSFTYATKELRPYGAKINGYGGYSCGPEPLANMVKSITTIFYNRQNQKLRPTDVGDIVNIVGYLINKSYRRNAQMLIGDYNDDLFLKRNRWDLIDVPSHRSMSNDTIQIEHMEQLSQDFWDTYELPGEPIGIQNIELCRKRGRLLANDPIDPDIIATNPCLSESTTVLTQEGIRTIKDIDAGSIIWSKQGWTKVLKKWKTGNKPVYKYTTSSGFFLGTDNHRILENGNKVEVDNAENIDTCLGNYDSEITHNYQYVLDGLTFGDGSVHKASNNLIYLCVGENDNYDNCEISQYILKERNGLSSGKKMKTFEVNTTLDYRELPKTYNRIIPDRFIFNKKENVASFLRGLYSANGSVVSNRITLKTSSIDVRNQVQLMLSSIGIRSYFTTNKSKEVEFSNGIYTCRESYDINISYGREKFYKIIGFIHEYKNKKLEKIINIKTPNREKTSFDVISKEYIGDEDVYDITVDNSSHTFWSGGLDISNCGEEPLENYGRCLLKKIVLMNVTSKEQAKEILPLIFKIAKATCMGNYLYPESQEVSRQNMRIGITPSTINEPHIFSGKDIFELSNFIYEYDKELSLKWNVPLSIRKTTVQPEGTSSAIYGNGYLASPGMHQPLFRYGIRRVRMGNNEKLLDVCLQNGYHVEPVKTIDGKNDPYLSVVEFPCMSNPKVKTASQVSAIEQLERQKKLQQIWSDASISCTVHYKKEELPLIKKWLQENFKDNVKSVSFLQQSDHGFMQAPYEPISEEKYHQLKSKTKPIVSTNVNTYTEEISSECANGVCSIR